MTTDLPPELRLTVLKHLAGGKTLDLTASITRLTRDQVFDIGSRHGYPRLDSLARAVEVVTRNLEQAQAAAAISTDTRSPSGVSLDVVRRPTPTPGPTTHPAAKPAARDFTRELLDLGAASTYVRTRKLTARIREQLRTLRDELAKENAKTTAERSAREAKEAAAREKLRARQERTAAAAARREARDQAARERAQRSANPRTDLERHLRDNLGVTTRQIKEWAVAQGLLAEVKRGRIAASIVDAWEQAHPDATQGAA